MHRSLIAPLALLLLAAPAAAEVSDFLQQHPPVADAINLLDVWIEEQRTYHQLPGLSIGLVCDQELIWAKGYGSKDLATGAPATAATLYRIGSLTKLFTATAILQLRDRGKLRLDDPVASHLSDFEVDSPFSEAPEITIRHLLTHTSGLPREAAFPYWTDHDFPSRDEILAALPNQPAVFPPAEIYKYSNLGMALLGEVVSALSKQDYADYVREHIFLPLGMTRSTVVPSAEHRREMATAYMRRMPDGGRSVFEYYETRGMAAAANIVSSVEDLARFAALQLQDGAAGTSNGVLRYSTVREMQRPHWIYPSWEGGRGLGFGISRRDGKTTVSHGGWIGGHRSHLLLVPDDKIAVIAMVNADDGSPSLFSYQVYDLVAPVIAARAAPAPRDKRVDPAWDRYLGIYADPWGWEYRVLILDDELVLYSHNYPPAEDAEDGITRLELLAEHTFKMPDGELVVFELGENGTVERVQRRYDYLYPVKR